MCFTLFQKGLGTLTQIVRIDLSKNQIKGLPDAIGNLTNLKHLNLSKNQITTLPATLGNLKNLKHLDLSNNPLAQKFSELVGPCQNENQCQQAAKNVVKAFSSQSDSDKKKKQKDSGNLFFTVSTYLLELQNHTILLSLSRTRFEEEENRQENSKRRYHQSV